MRLVALALLTGWLLAVSSPARADQIAGHAAELADTLSAEWMVGGEHRRIDTPSGAIHVWTPFGYRRETAITVVYIHGYWVDVDDAWLAHGLPEQFGASGINAMFIACAAPAGPPDHVRWASVSELLALVERELAVPLPSGRVAAVGHSGAYRTLYSWLADPRLDTVVMLDAGYGDMLPYAAWVNGAKTRRLISVGDDTIGWTTALHRRLPGTVTLDTFAKLADPAVRARLQHARLLHIKSDLGHMRVVTAAIALPTLLRLLNAVPLVLTAE